MKILLFGENGQVGWELNRTLQPIGNVISLGREDADFSSPESLRKIIQKVGPNVIINAVAYTAVDKAEEEEDLATVVNAISPGVLADEALKVNALLIHYSTDYVFDGKKNGPYVETDKPNPINAYGRTKLAGEIAIQSSGCDYLIFRTSWVYATRGSNFLLTILKLAKEKDELSVVVDQVGSPTSANLIAETSTLCIEQSIKDSQLGDFKSDLYHLTSSGFTSWHGFAQEIIIMFNKNSKSKFNISSLKAISTVDYPTPAKRPMRSRLNLDKLEIVFGQTMPDWKAVLAECEKEIDFSLIA